MTRISILLVCGVFLAATQGVASAATPAFENCVSAYNYAQNTARLYVSAAMNRAACVPSEVEKSEDALYKSLKKQKLQADNTDALKVCFYDGLYEGYVSELWSEYDECSRSLPLFSVARAAVAVFSAMQDSMNDVNDSAVNVVFGYNYTVDDDADTNGCVSYLRSALPDSPSGFDRLVATVCLNQ